MRMLEGSESNFRSLRPALRITCSRVRTSLLRGMCMQCLDFVYLPRLIACGYEVYVGYSGIFEGLYCFYYVDYCAAGANAYIAC